MKNLFLFAAVLMMFSCKRETVAKALPVIVINTPVNNQHFSNGDTIHITGTVTHTVALTEVAVHMTDISNNSEFFHNHFSAANKTFFSFDSKYMLPDDKKTSYKVEVEADDAAGNTATKEITIIIN